MSLFEVILREQTNAQQIINRWNYESNAAPLDNSGSAALAQMFGSAVSGTPPVFPVGSVLEAVQAIQTNDCIFVELIVLNVYVESDFITVAFPTGVFGGVAQAGASLFVASGFRTNRVTRAVRRGFKRFAAVPVTAIGEFGQLSGGHLTAMATLADRMSDPLLYTSGGSNVTYTPVIVSKQKYTTPNGNTAYRYYSTLAEQQAHLASGITWEVYQLTRSQGSRQLGRGQ